jgi:hypothetical protein
MRWAFLWCCVYLSVFTADIPHAPAVEFRELAWYGPTVHGGYGLFPGQDNTPMLTTMGRIEPKRLLGKQQMVWMHRYYDVQSVLIDDAGVVYVAFELGTLSLRHFEHRSWDVQFTPRRQQLPTQHFRTFCQSGISYPVYDSRVTSSITLPNN